MKAGLNLAAPQRPEPSAALQQGRDHRDSNEIDTTGSGSARSCSAASLS